MTFTQWPIPGPSGGDPLFANVVALLGCEGADGSNTFTDVIGNSWTETYGGIYDGAQISTTRGKFGSSSLRLDGQDIISGPSNHAPFLLDGDFSIEYWLYQQAVPSGPSSGHIYLQGSLRDIFINFTSSQTMTFAYGNSALINKAAVPLNQWVHVYFGRVGSTLYAAIDGDVTTGVVTLGPDSILVAQIGGTSLLAGSLYWYMNELRITKGVGRYTANFAVPTSRYPRA